MSHNNSIKKLLNIKDKFFKIDKVLDENINGLLTKVVYATASKKIIPVLTVKINLLKMVLKKLILKC